MLPAVIPASSVRLLASTLEACCSSVLNLPGTVPICGHPPTVRWSYGAVCFKRHVGAQMAGRVKSQHPVAPFDDDVSCADMYGLV